MKRIGIGLVLAAAACGGSSPARVAAPVATTVTSASPTATEPAAGGYGGAPVVAVPTRTAAPATRSPAASPKQAAKPSPKTASTSAPKPSPTPVRTSSPKPPPSSPAAAPTTYAIQMRGLTFSPDSLAIRVGDSVRVSNADSAHHTFTDRPLFDSGDLAPGRTFTYRFASAGRYSFVCSYHAGSGMTGTVTVH